MPTVVVVSWNGSVEMRTEIGTKNVTKLTVSDELTGVVCKPLLSWESKKVGWLTVPPHVQELPFSSGYVGGKAVISRVVVLG